MCANNLSTAGALTVADMEALFKPVPFGHTGHETPLAQLTQSNNLPVWDLFRNIDEERQNNTLQVGCLDNFLLDACTAAPIFPDRLYAWYSRLHAAYKG